ncbi:MAG: hypothetical protein BWY21_02064 [Parcubacteria group bacterium ADurb.Bin216]|jgi:hypothetical protein|nr:MAG: hypothetical protein BWY21_02064 [Parcubacteria group bacterium ADurb.Bin216]
MFAHQVIENYYDYHDSFEMVDSYGFIEFSIKHLHNAHCFHLGEYFQLRETCKSITGKPIFSDYQYMNLPYQCTWFDLFKASNTSSEIWKDDDLIDLTTKIGILVIQRNDEWDVYRFSYGFKAKMWTPDLLLQTVHKVGTKDMIANVTYEYISNHQRANDLINSEHGEELLVDTAIETLAILNSALLLLNCKNITTEIIQPPEKLNIKRRKKGKQELFSYHVLNVTLPPQKQGYREKTDPNYHVRVHLCRGHFKEYTPEHPLFGKLTGLYWWQPHVRGQDHSGIVMKDYEVKQRAVA